MKVLIVLPSYNEAKILGANVIRLVEFVRKNLPADQFKIMISDNNSSDNTREIARVLQEKYPEIDYLFMPRQGKGEAIFRAWTKWQADFDIFIFMDADLAVDLAALLELVKAIQSGYDLALGSRQHNASQVKNSPQRKFFSWGYGLVVRLLLGLKIKDLTCGFKAVNQKVIKEILPLVQEKTWFFDSELVYLAAKKGLKIKEIPVSWQEPRLAGDSSRVNVLKVSWLYLTKAWQLKFRKIN